MCQSANAKRSDFLQARSGIRQVTQIGWNGFEADSLALDQYLSTGVLAVTELVDPVGNWCEFHDGSH